MLNLLLISFQSVLDFIIWYESHRSSVKADVQEILESMRPDFGKLDTLISKPLETNDALISNLIEINRKFKENHEYFELLIKETGYLRRSRDGKYCSK